MKKILFIIAFLFSIVAKSQTTSELQTILSTSQGDLFITGQGSQLTLNNNVILATAGTGSIDVGSSGTISYQSVYLQIVPAAGTVTAGVITFEGSNDNFASTALPILLYDENSQTANPVSSYTIVASTPRYFAGSTEFRYFRARISTGVTGTTTGVQCFSKFSRQPFVPNVNVVSQATAANLQMTATQSGTWTVQPGNTVNTTAWLMEQRTGTTNASTTTNLNSAATTNATLVKASAGMVYFVSVTNTSAAIKYVRLYNLTTAPTVGTSTPVMVIAVPATSSKEVMIPNGLKFATGISYAITNAAAYLDATAVAAGDVQLLINYN